MRLFENTLWQTLDQVAGRGFLFAFYLAIPLVIGLDDYGRFAFLQSLALILIQPALFLGLELLVVAGVSGGDRGVFGAAFGLRAVAVAVTGSLVALAGVWTTPESRQVLWLLWFYQGTQGLLSLFFAHFRGIESMRMEGIVGLSQKATALPLLGLLALLGVRGAVVPALTLALVGVIGCLLLAGPYRGAVSPLLLGLRRPRYDYARVRSLLRDGARLGLAGFVGAVYFRLGSILLGLLGSAAAVGAYAAAFRIMEATQIVPMVVTNVGLPRLVRAADPPTAAVRWALLLATPGVAVSVGLLLVAERLVGALYGASFVAAGSALEVLGLAVAPIYAGHVLTQALVVTQRTDAYLRIAVTSVVLNVTLNLISIPFWGETGAAFATVLTELAVVTLCVRTLSPPSSARARLRPR